MVKRRKEVAVNKCHNEKNSKENQKSVHKESTLRKLLFTIATEEGALELKKNRQGP